MKALTYVELDIAFCELTYGVLPCQAALGVTGAIKCFNSKVTCQDPANFTPGDVTLRFAIAADYLPADIPAIPSIQAVDHTPSTISLGKDLGQRASVKVMFKDHPHSDTGTGFDNYRTERSYDPFTQGTFFGKFRARQPFLRGRSMRLIRGELGQTLAQMETRHFIVESFDGPTPDGEYALIGKDVLKLADGDRANAPAPSRGFLLGDLTETATSATLSPAGIGDSDYPTDGYLALGGKEIVQFHRDALTSALLHFDADDASTTMLDSAINDRVITVTGSAQIDTGQSKFGGSSLQTQGSDDYIDLDGAADLAFGTGDFTIEFWARFSSVGSDVLCDFRAASGDIAPTIQTETTTDTLRYHTAGVLRITGTTVITTGTFHHIAVSRSGTSTRLFLNGTQEGSTFSDSSNYIVGANRPRFGADFAAANDWTGHLDEVRISKGVARYTANFTPPTVPFELSSSGDVIRLSKRAQLGTSAQSHEAQDRAQKLLQYDVEDPAEIIYDLLVNFAGIDPDWISLSAWLSETQTYLGQVYSAIIAEPTPVHALVSELIDQAALSLWWNDVDQRIQLRVLRAIPSSAATFDEDNVIQDSLEIRDQHEKRISQVWTYFGKINPLAKDDETDNYRSFEVSIDEAAEEDYGSPVIKKIFSRWIPQFGRSIATAANAIQLARFRDPPRRFNFELMRNSVDTPILGGGYRVEAWPIQDATGAPASVPIHITRLRAEAHGFELEAEEMLGIADEGDSPSTAQRVITIDVNTSNINLRTVHDTLYTAPVGGEDIVCFIQEGVIVGSASTALPAFDVGSWPANVHILLRVTGRIQGAGGRGGRNDLGGDGEDGQPGGTALYTRYQVDVDLSSAEVWAGGGGGGGTSAGGSGATGGGGAGTVPGQPGVPNGGVAGNPGTSEAGGLGGDGSGFDGGAGGAPGLPGSAAPAGSDPGQGGAAGTAIDGASFLVTTTGGPGDVRGAQIN